MKLQRPRAARLLGRIAGCSAVLFASLVAGLFADVWAIVFAALMASAVGLWFDRSAERRYARRRELVASPFPTAWRGLLEARCDHYVRLSDELRRRFENDLRVFLGEKRVTGIDQALDDELLLLVAASAVTLSLGFPDHDWDELTEVLVYPQDFARDHSFGRAELAGEAHAWGTVILSAPALRHSFADPEDGFHVGFHEFAHLLDLDGSTFDGLLPGLSDRQAHTWLELVERETARVERGKSVLDSYAAESPVEFLAVAVEAFFECPLALRQRHRELYAVLSAFFRQDPAGWDEVRGFLPP